MTYFNPETVEMIPSIKKNLLLDLEVNNKHVAIGEKRNGQVILQKDFLILMSLLWLMPTVTFAFIQQLAIFGRTSEV